MLYVKEKNDIIDKSDQKYSDSNPRHRTVRATLLLIVYGDFSSESSDLRAALNHQTSASARGQVREGGEQGAFSCA